MATAPIQPPAPTIDLAKVTETYIKIREAKSALTKQYDAAVEKLDQQLETLGGFLLKHLNEQNVNSVATPCGTFFRQEDVKPSIADDAALFAWVKETGACDVFERRVSKTFVKEFIATHEGSLPPPGIAVHREY